MMGQVKVSVKKVLCILIGEKEMNRQYFIVVCVIAWALMGGGAGDVCPLNLSRAGDQMFTNVFYLTP